MPEPTLAVLHNLATQLRIDSVRSTTAAGSGHPTTCLSAAEIIAAVFFAEMRFDPLDPQHPEADRFVLSKGHAAPILYAAWAAAGAFPRDEVLHLRELTSDLEGHPTPRLPFVDVATGSLGQGLAAGVGVAFNARRIDSDYRTYVLMGDGESAEGSVWEAAQVAAYHHLDNLCAITDVNGYGQSRATQWGRDADAFVSRWRAFGWHTLSVDGHDLAQVLAALAEARRTTGRPTMIIARTLKGKGVALFEDKDGWHGKPLKKGAEADRAIAELEAQYVTTTDAAPVIPRPARRRTEGPLPDFTSALPAPAYRLGDSVATREAYGTALAALGAIDRRVVALDADVKNSTYSDRFEDLYPDRFYQAFIAEQAMVGAAMGLAARGAIPFPSSFACFLGRASDFVRMAGISTLNVKLAGSHAGVSIGEDGPSQMALEDLAIMRAVPELHGVLPVGRHERRAAGRARGRHAGARVHPHHPAEDAGDLRRQRDVRRRRIEDDSPERLVTRSRSSPPASRCSRRSRRTTRSLPTASPFASSTRTACSRSIARAWWRRGARPGGASSPWKITTRTAASAMP